VTPSDDEITQRLRGCVAAEVVALGLRGRLEQKLPSLIDRGETVEFVGTCTPAGRWWTEVRDPRVIVTTDRRLMLVSTAFLLATTLVEEATAPQATVISYRDVRGVRERLGWFESKLELDVGGTTVQVTSMRRRSARTVAEVIRRHAPVAPAGW
jgi:hypothetical protein